MCCNFCVDFPRDSSFSICSIIGINLRHGLWKKSFTPQDCTYYSSVQSSPFSSCTILWFKKLSQWLFISQHRPFMSNLFSLSVQRFNVHALEYQFHTATFFKLASHCTKFVRVRSYKLCGSKIFSATVTGRTWLWMSFAVVVEPTLSSFKLFVV